jgi:hypothetical protein
LELFISNLCSGHFPFVAIIFTSLAYEIFYARKVDLFEKIKEVVFSQLFPCVNGSEKMFHSTNGTNSKAHYQHVMVSLPPGVLRGCHNHTYIRKKLMCTALSYTFFPHSATKNPPLFAKARYNKIRSPKGYKFQRNIGFLSQWVPSPSRKNGLCLKRKLRQTSNYVIKFSPS